MNVRVGQRIGRRSWVSVGVPWWLALPVFAVTAIVWLSVWLFVAATMLVSLCASLVNHYRDRPR